MSRFRSGWDIAFWAFVAVYAFCIVYKSSMPLMSGDDIAFFMGLRDGGSAWHGLDFGSKRFFPLAGWNLNLIASISTSPYAFMIGNALVFVIIACCYYALARSFGANKALVFVSFVIFALSVGYVKIITQIPFPENTQIMFLLLFLLCVQRVFVKMKNPDIYIYIYHTCARVWKRGYLPQRSFVCLD
ncbi:hypothetical protein CQA49_07955 [Helicobacter sp. MIT 00-7814]|uniref:hypothetical protein n=1 Tax=unclassified Helicobacter TaxID=2593540 RepID=UPI000E1EA9DF|nr:MULTISPECIES: hypothetical protein [unclassified Helicobacter]RDU52622.1 hypothetical protein CQA49_07955 [Helicobacter sp. MIT 00-7814]RDU55921.1 hypothetical protein CQA37_03235 [Helicobacter sp. MIT 99-10781]